MQPSGHMLKLIYQQQPAFKLNSNVIVSLMKHSQCHICKNYIHVLEFCKASFLTTVFISNLMCLFPGFFKRPQSCSEPQHQQQLNNSEFKMLPRNWALNIKHVKH